MTDVAAAGYDPFAPTVQADPYPHYTALRRAAPVYYVESLDAYAVSRHADVRRVMQDHDAFSNEAMAALVSRPVDYGRDAGTIDASGPAPISIVGLDGDDHARLRMIVNRGFTPRHIANLEREIRELARAFVEPFAAQASGDLMSAFAEPFPTVVIAAMLGVDPGKRADFRRWSEHMVRAVFEPTSPEQQREIAQSGDEMSQYLDEVISTRDHSTGDDLVSLLLRAELEGGALSHDELYTFVFTLLVAGSITTAYLIGNAVMTLVQEPEIQALVRADPGLVPAVIEESLRHDAPVQMMFRTATAAVEIAGTTIPRGATVLPLIASANRDERVFVEAERFDPARSTTESLAFGHGVHFCLGAALARIEARIALEELLALAPRLEATDSMERVTSLVFRGPTRLPLGCS